jgi:hypothetical protein
MAFDIPAEPLQNALDDYGVVTGISGFYRTDATVGHTSATIKGRYTPDAALRMLIEGTGLVVHYTAADAFVLESAPRGDDRPTGRDPRYDGLVQSRVRDAFCRDPFTAPGDYRTAISFRVDPAGHIGQPRLLDSTGDTARDRAILDALQHVDVGLPPANASRDFVMLILPQSLTSGQDCVRH